MRLDSVRSRPRAGRHRWAALLAAAILLLACGGSDAPASTAATALVSRSQELTAATSGTSAFTVEHSIAYGTGEVRSPVPARAALLLDLYRPTEAPDRAPVVVVIHGGGFYKQSRTDGGIVDVSEALAARGIVAVAIDYRLMPQEPVPSARVRPLVDALPATDYSLAVAAAVDDTLTAIDYLADHADELDIDPHRLGLIGSSAGAITADHVAYALDDHGIAGPAVIFVGSLWGGILVAPSPAQGVVSAVQLDEGEAALFAVHGEHDRIVPVTSSDALVRRAEDTGVRVEYHRLDGAGHGFGGSGFFTTPVDGTDTSFDRLVAFAAELLG